jgi:hypothetical protein
MIRIILDDALPDERRIWRPTDSPKDRVRIEIAAHSDAGRSRFEPGHAGRITVGRYRFTLAALMGSLVLVAVGLAALRSPTAVWASLVILVALGTICGATVGAILRRGSDRRAWLGFAVFGWAYFLLTLSPWGGEYGLGPARFLTRASTALLLRIDPDLVEMPVTGVEEFVVFTGTGKSRSYFHGIFHALTSLIFAALGALVGRVVAASGDPEPSSPSTPGP